jgi:hypothetical protein
MPGFVPSAGPKVIVVLEMLAPFVCEDPLNAPTVVTPPLIVKLPLPKTELPLIVFMFVPLTSTSCFVGKLYDILVPYKIIQLLLPSD